MQFNKKKLYNTNVKFYKANEIYPKQRYEKCYSTNRNITILYRLKKKYTRIYIEIID